MKFDVSKKNDIKYIVEWIEQVYGPRDPDEEEVGELDMYDLFHMTRIGSEVCDESGVRAFLVYKIGGGEGEGENVVRVLAIAHKDSEVQPHHSTSLIKDAYCYVSLGGYYASYDGITWNDEWYFVSPQIVTDVDFKVV